MATNTPYGQGSATTTAETANATIDRYIPARTLAVAKYSTKLYGLCRHEKLPAGESKTVSYTRWPHLALPLVPATEGTPPAAQQLTTERVSVTLEQWIAVVSVTDIGELITRGSPVDIASTRMGEQAARVMDREIVRTAMGASTVFFPGSITTRSSITSADVPNTAMCRRIKARLGANGASFYEGDRYIGLCDTYHEMDMHGDATFVDASTYSKITNLENGEVGIWCGIRWVVSNTLPTQALIAGAITKAAASAAPGETVLPDATYRIVVTKLDTNGFETQVYAEVNQATSTQVLTVTIPTSTGSYFNVYVSTTAGGPYYLQKERAASAEVIRVCGTGTGTPLSVTYTTTAGVLQGVPASGVTIHTGFVFGRDFITCSELQKLQTYRVSGASKSDPANQQTLLSWKMMFKALITDNAFGCKFEAATANG